MEYGLLLLITAVVSGGALGAIVRAWSMSSRLYSLEDRVMILEGVTQREVKIRASESRWRKPSKDEDFIEKVFANQKESKAKAKAWWVEAAEKHPRVASE